MQSKLKGIFKDFLSLGRKEKAKCSLKFFIFVSFFLYATSVPLCSYNSFHLVPIALIAVFSILVVVWLFTFGKVKIDGFVLSIVIFLFAVVISSLSSKFTIWSQSYFLLPFSSLIIYEFGCENGHWKTMVGLFYLSLCIFCLVFMIYYRNEFLSGNIERIGFAFGNVTQIFKPLAIGTVVALYYILFLHKYVNIIPFIAFVIEGFSTGSKGFLFYIVIGCVLLVFMAFGKKKIWVSFAIIGSLLIAFLIMINLPIFSNYKTRFLDFLSTFGISIDGHYHFDLSTEERSYMLKESLSDFFFSPFIGWGMNGYTSLSIFPYSHNTWGEVLSGFGLLGSIPYSYIVFRPFIAILDRIKSKYYPLLLALLICIFFSHFNTVYFIDKTFWIIIAINASSTVNKEVDSVKRKDQPKEDELLSFTL